MPDEIEPVPETVTPAVVAKPTETPKPVASVVEEANGGDGKSLQVKHEDFKKIKEEARERGRREAAADYEAKAKQAGYASLDEIFQTPKKPIVTKPVVVVPPKKVITMPKPTITPPQTAAPAADNDSERRKMRKQWRTEEKRRRRLEAELASKDAEIALRDELYKFGVSDVDYGLLILRKEMAGKTEEELAKFDRKAFFDGIRKDRPYLFGERVQPANTGTNGQAADGSDPKTPAAGAPVVEVAKEQRFDAMKAKPEEVQARMNKLGLNPNQL